MKGGRGGSDVMGAALQLVLLWPCPPCSLSHFLFLTWNLYLESSLLSALHSWVNSESREMNIGLKSDLHSPQRLRMHVRTEQPWLTRLSAEVSFRLNCLHEYSCLFIVWPAVSISSCCLRWLSWVSLAFYEKKKKIAQMSYCQMMESFGPCNLQPSMT